MYGITLPIMSSEGTPGYPAPDTACIVERKSCLIANFWCSGARATAATVAEQFALVTIAPLQPRFLRWQSIRPRWSPLTSGITSGTSGSIRKFLVLLNTNFPAFANAISTSPATAASSAENTIGALTTPGSHAMTRRVEIVGGGGAPSSQRVTSPYFLPAERSDAANSATSNHG